MKVTFIGHAAILIETQGIRLLSDPWWKGPCFGAQWWIFPTPDIDSVDSAPIDYIYISHGHHDHYHPGTLKSFSRDTRILVSKDIGIAPAIRELGFEVIEVKADEEYALGHGVTCRIWETRNRDTLMAVSDGGEVCVNLNDAMHPYSREIQDIHIQKLTEHYQKIDYAFCGYGVASHFPNCYRIPGKDPCSTAAQRQHYFNVQWTEIISRLEPAYGFPFAAGVVFLEEDLFWSNEPTHNSERPTDVFETRFPQSHTNIIDIAPGFSIENGKIAKSRVWQPLSAEALRKDYADLIQRANRYGGVNDEKLEEVKNSLEANITKCSLYLNSFSGSYRALIRFRNSDIGFSIIKDTGNIHVSTVSLSDIEASEFDLTYTTRLHYLDWSLTTEYGHEILFVGSGGIFDYHDRTQVPRNLHRELMVMMRRHETPPPPRPHRSRTIAKVKQLAKKLLKAQDVDLYDLNRWTVFK